MSTLAVLELMILVALLMVLVAESLLDPLVEMGEFELRIYPVEIGSHAFYLETAAPFRSLLLHGFAQATT
jgi:hypothetical protein